MAKHLKLSVKEGVRLFNWKIKKGISFLLEESVIRKEDPAGIASFLLHTDGLNKAHIGEFLGATRDIVLIHPYRFVVAEMQARCSHHFQVMALSGTLP